MEDRTDRGNEESAVADGLGVTGLAAENARYAGTGGVSAVNRRAGFIPAFMDRSSGKAVVSCYPDGRPAPVHVLDGLPDNWILSRGHDGKVQRVRPSVVAGFLRDGVFYTREAAARAVGQEAR